PGRRGSEPRSPSEDTRTPRTPSDQVDPAWKIPPAPASPVHINNDARRDRLSPGTGRPGAGVLSSRTGGLRPRGASEAGARSLGRSAAATVSPAPDKWKLYSSMAVKILKLPNGTTTWEIWRALEQRATVLY